MKVKCLVKFAQPKFPKIKKIVNKTKNYLFHFTQIENYEKYLKTTLFLLAVSVVLTATTQQRPPKVDRKNAD
jgi:hypothetical protein